MTLLGIKPSRVRATIFFNWQAVAYLGAHLVTINKYSRPLFISAPTTFAPNGSWWYMPQVFPDLSPQFESKFTITNKVIVCGNTGPHSYYSDTMVPRERFELPKMSD